MASITVHKIHQDFSKQHIKLCTWNVRSMFQAGKINCTIREMERLQIDIMGISEMRWPGSGHCFVNDHHVYYAGLDDRDHQYGVGFIISKKLDKSVYNFSPISDRIILIQCKASPVNINFLQIYAPTADKKDDEVDEFYGILQQALKSLKKEELTVIMGDMNAKIGKGKQGQYVGEYGLGERNDRGHRLYQFCTEEDFVILNTMYELPPRRLYTWRAPSDKKDKIVRNQIDYIMVNHRFKNCFKSVKTYPGADVGSDHNALVGVCKSKVKKTQSKNFKKQPDFNGLKEDETNAKVRESLKTGLSEISNGNIKSVEENWTWIKDTVKKASEHLKTSYNRVKRQSWMTEEILDLMDERRICKNRDHDRYLALVDQIKREIKIAKELWMKNQCAEIESLEIQHDAFNLHKKIKESAGIKNCQKVACLRDDQGELVIDINKKLELWEHYIANLFSDTRNGTPQFDTNIEGPPITIEEVKYAIGRTKDGKATGPDDLNVELFKQLDENGFKIITKLFNVIYDTGILPDDWLKSTFFVIPKKASSKTCNDYRTICLMSHILKAFLKIIHGRIYKKCEDNIGDTQFGFRNALGTREALFSIQVLFQRCRDVNCDVFACFIDYQKAFDRVQHGKLIEILKRINIDEKDLRIISNLYWHQKASVKIDGHCTEYLEIQRGVRQGCVLSPMLFNIYSEEIFKEALEEIDDGILVNGVVLNNIRYADDTVIFADNIDALQRLMNKVVESSENYGLSLNIKKTKFMVISKNPTLMGNLLVKDQPVERVSKIKYLGCTVDERWDHSVEVKCRIEQARCCFIKMQKVLRCHDLSLSTKVRILRCYVFSVLFYGVEAWTLTEASCKKLEAFEMWCYRRILRISYTEHMSNKDVLQKMNKNLEVLYTVKKRKLEYFGHVMRNEDRYKVLQLILQGKVYGRRGPGRRRISWLKNLRSWFSTTTSQLFRNAVNKVMIAKWIADIRIG